MKILLAKPGLDGHDVGVKVLAHALKAAGFEVVYTGLRKSIEDIVAKAKTENVDAIGLSILSGTHLILCEQMNKVMKENKLTIPWVVGGNIPAGDVEALEKTGAGKAFPTGTQIETVVTFMKLLGEVKKNKSL
jgi:methylmalonyl-CoA mutase C-terminal domain/subunit